MITKQKKKQTDRCIAICSKVLIKLSIILVWFNEPPSAYLSHTLVSSVCCVRLSVVYLVLRFMHLCARRNTHVHFSDRKLVERSRIHRKRENVAIRTPHKLRLNPHAKRPTEYRKQNQIGKEKTRMLAILVSYGVLVFEVHLSVLATRRCLLHSCDSYSTAKTTSHEFVGNSVDFYIFIIYLCGYWRHGVVHVLKSHAQASCNRYMTAYVHA